MKIIRQGQIPEERIIRKSCKRCKTLFEFPLKEAKRTFDQRDGDFTTIKCPTCKELIYLTDAECKV